MATPGKKKRKTRSKAGAFRKESAAAAGNLVVAPRTLVPVDEDSLIESVRKTGYALIVDEGALRYGVTGELTSLIGEAAFDYLDAPVRRIGAAGLPLPFSPTLEAATIPTVADIVGTVRAMRGIRS